MQSTVKSLKVTYNDVRENGTFTNGDTLNGQVILEVTKDCKVESLYVKFKAKAEVMWSERHYKHTYTYYDKKKYFSLKHYFIRDGNETDGNQLLNENGKTYSDLLPPGSHVFPFTFQVPLQEIPSSFSGSVGEIVYQLETKLCRSMRFRTKETLKIPFVATVAPDTLAQLMMTPQQDFKDKNMHVFSSGAVAMDVKIEKSGVFQGEALQISGSIQNNSSRDITPKYCIYSKHSFFARGKRKLDTKDLLKEVGEPIPPSASVTINKVITVPPYVKPSILNCEIIKLEYRLRVYLDVKYSSDPEVKFPITILPGFQASAMAANMPSTSTGFEFASHGYQNPPAFDTFSTPQPFNPPPSYGGHGMYPSLMDFGSKQ
nr:arrestin domain-containing protein 3-like [Nerophis lumbriciformis]